jgi:hypothetical protein
MAREKDRVQLGADDLGVGVGARRGWGVRGVYEMTILPFNKLNQQKFIFYRSDRM